MAGLCEVCSSEPSKYRCPTCELMSCSLVCTQSHKIYCTPKGPGPSPRPSEQATTLGDSPAQTSDHHPPVTPAALGSSQELQAVFAQHPALRSQLLDIYKSTREEAWVEQPRRPLGRGRGGGGGGGGGGYRPYRGPWSAEKGFNRGLGRVRKWREQCEGGLEVGKTAEGFMRFIALVNKNGSSQEP
ncbi:hypothetical protein ASPZODRAFT_15217 [Penicilliopsis zonata CBS 506.65]|uniref:HIT-type domain-containing protein n=1 Tax=Penicilliopsis zonata CBS 506.65 TaxID=1073090 RepID=A0A1L9SKY4_9EURO|nr:hypothetical protein ASPZODRAFT_15217 [Penicilliopsis zonata CBS 506.65]OJJ47771.1 hypothetical protein ASPZODRAFT_15217 [Penicilliopsis zonata CBS 506.65]